MHYWHILNSKLLIYTTDICWILSNKYTLVTSTEYEVINISNDYAMPRCGGEEGRLVHVCPGSLARTVRQHALPCISPDDILSVINATWDPCNPPEKVDPCKPPPVADPDVPVKPCKVTVCYKKPCMFGDECSPCYATSNHRPVYRSKFNLCAPCPSCPPEPFINCVPNIPPQPCGGAAWRPTPPAMRGSPAVQRHHVPSGTEVCSPCPERGGCYRKCTSRDLVLPRSDYKLELCVICPRECLRRCGYPHAATPNTCGSFGMRKNNEQISTNYSYPGEWVISLWSGEWVTTSYIYPGEGVNGFLPTIATQVTECIGYYSYVVRVNGLLSTNSYMYI